MEFSSSDRASSSNFVLGCPLSGSISPSAKERSGAARPDFAACWGVGAAPEGPVRCAAKIRYRHPEQPCLLTPLPGGGVRLDFDEAQRAITPGQSAVVYDGETVLGGGELL